MANKDLKLRKGNQIAAKNIHKRGSVPKTLKKEESKYPVGPLLLALFIFVVIGSALFELFRLKM